MTSSFKHDWEKSPPPFDPTSHDNRIFIGTMRAVVTGQFTDDPADRAMAHAIFRTPNNKRTTFTEPHGILGIINNLWPTANIIHVWIEHPEETRWPR